ncbi:hypothetical protein [Nannocystis punicea]|uniref:Lipoprotein n=1 Tax=Nannocystis punicea TaxID=2995304 RepID=A0ABY7HAQ9_9BACT|nr:hypothetical protein [Nannocystis poenicansa]WAS96197.1 hypothetical protein O0S08_08540 [Nannocystis poenicansa]
MNAGARVRLAAASLMLGGCHAGPDMPPTVASSKYIEYHTDADASVLCMDDMLEREDRFIERTAELLGVVPPTKPVHYVWDPVQDGSEAWACSSGTDCYKLHDDDLSMVVSRRASYHHELVHAVEAQALGQGHRLLVEGTAEYLGSLQSSAVLPADFPAAFAAAFSVSDDGDYRVALHFVGSIFARHGAAKYRALRERVPADADLTRFAAEFEAEFGQPLADALAEMSGEVVYGQDLFRGCGEGETRVLEWTDEGVVDAAIEGECGDPFFYGTGFVRGEQGFVGLYAVEVAEAGTYALTVGGVADGPAPLRGLLVGCSFDMLGSGVASLGGRTGEGVLQAGRYVLSIGFPQGPQARGSASVRLERVGPLP